jgi:predicted SAM-dependent methyltransferase
MQLLNVGCGSRFSKGKEWTNIDIVSTGEGVIAHNLRTGIPYPDGTFDLVYHSHVLEHIPKQQADAFIRECVRVLKPGGILRVAIPDLEQISRNYMRLMEAGVNNPDSAEIAADYDWMMLEMYDQTVRSKSGGQMMDFLNNPTIKNEEFVLSRCGYEVKRLLDLAKNKVKNNDAAQISKPFNPGLLRIIWECIKSSEVRKDVILRRLLKGDYEALQVGLFRQSGEVHQWMYDRYSVSRIFAANGLKETLQRKATESYYESWSSFHLDSQPDGSTYKPDSLFIEGRKPI